MKTLIARLRANPALVISCLALFVALGGASYAAIKLPAKSVGTKQLKRNAVISSKVKNGSLRKVDFGAGQLPTGPTGPAGSPDTPQQVRAKLLQVDGAGSGLDADSLDGVSSGGFPKIAFELTSPWDPPDLSAGTCTFLTLTDDRLLPGDTVLVTDSSESRYSAIQLSHFVQFNPGRIFIQACNNGSVARDQETMNLSIMVLRSEDPA